MRFLGGRVVIAATAIFGVVAVVACSASYDGVGGYALEGPPGAGSVGYCTEDAGVLTPIGAQGCGANQTVVYRRPLSGAGGSAIGTGAGAAKTPTAAMVTACTDTQCGPGQVAVVTYQPSVPTVPFSTEGGVGSDDAPAATAIADGAAPPVDDGAALPPDGAGSVADAGAAPPPVDASPEASGEAPDASPPATTDASAVAAASADDAGVIGIPCGAVVTCVDLPPTCPAGQSPSYAPSGKWHCMPDCDPSNSNTVVITYGATYGNATICAGPPPTSACPQGQVWTWDYQDEEWVCAAECNNGQYDRHTYAGQTVCVPC
jgi:hypothetical protein